MAAGLGFKTFNTGDVLTAADTNGYLMQGVWVFANAAARTSAVTSPQEGNVSFLKDTNSLEIYDGAAWVAYGAGDITEVQAGTGISVASGTGPVPVVTNTVATTFDAKGDLVVGTGSDTFAKLTVGGTNGHTLQVDSSTSTGLKWAAAASGKTWNSVASGNISTGVATQTFSGLTAYDEYFLYIYQIVTTANNTTFELTMNNTGAYAGWGTKYAAYAGDRSTVNSGVGQGFRLNTLNIIGTTASYSWLQINGCKSTGTKQFQYYSNSGYLSETDMATGWTVNTTAALSSITITTNGTFNGGTYAIYGA